MKKYMPIAVLLFFILNLSLHSNSTPSESRQFEFGTNFTLKIDLDPTWTFEFKKRNKEDAELNLINPLNSKEKCRIYIIPQPKVLEKEVIINMLKDNGDTLLNQSLEKEFSFIPIPNAHGFYYILTDKEPKPGEPTLIARGAISSPKHLTLFTILFEQRDSSFFQDLIKVLASARIDTVK